MGKDRKERIITAAEELFQEKSFEEVGIREIAQRAGCSHTTLYLYFRTKNDILSAVAQEPLEELYSQFLAIQELETSAGQKLLALAETFVIFSFQHRNSYQLLLLAGGERVDKEDFDLPLNRIRLQCFAILRENVESLLPKDLSEEEKLNISRGVFLFLQGLVSVYSLEKPTDFAHLEQITKDYLNYTILNKGLK
ncbi:TetR/AcrR family transcriptional regulator [Streptococcus oricebi]|uniref:TetR/AcrR family transcriptional regulator n=1 Tax=Streptococcus oricebi TaxID=1547447 RepID=A0ABS5B3F7_9STRE|nr:TetR/AcrR family transcriptional regulator [Streptococcus oricebi]